METPKTLKTLRSLAETCPEDRRREVLEASIVFAMFTVQDQTGKAEKRFTWWWENGRPMDGLFPPGLGVRYPNVMRRQLTSVKRFLSHRSNVQAVWDSPTEGQDLLVKKVTGLSHAKARFSLALAGVGRGACLDVHVMREYRNLLAGCLTPGELKRGTAPGTAKRYATAEVILANEWRTPSDPAVGQWAWWFGYRTTTGLGVEEHAPFVDVIRDIVGG